MSKPLFLLSTAAALAISAADAFSAIDPVAAASPARLKERVSVIASDEMEGRGPGTAGEDKVIAYLVSEFKKLGLAPGNPNGTYIQDAPLAGITSATTLTFQAGGKTIAPMPVTEYTGLSRRIVPQIDFKASDVVFVGYGVVAPEYGWDDYKGVDVRGKTVVMLINDPPVLDAKDPSKLDEAMFRGRAMTYYGRWTYKYEIASAKGAAACIIVHETGPAGYPFAVLGPQYGREQFDLQSPNGNAGRVGWEGWITVDIARKLFKAAGNDYDALKAKAATRDFAPVPLAATADITATNTVRNIASKNAIALLPGTDPKLKDEYVVVTAHWDHLGRDERLKGDQIFNGAMDNATGTGLLLELASQFTSLPAAQRPKRSIVFLSVTAEEKGLLGARYYAENPLYPLTQTVANVNMDGGNIYAPTRDIEVVGAGATTIEDLAAEIARADNRVLVPETEPEKGYYYRSDHFEFAKVGVPAFYTSEGSEPIGKPADYLRKKRDDYTANHYHKVSDQVSDDWDFTAIAQESNFLFEVTRRLATQTEWPEWKAGSEFKARRDAMLKR